ncbi:3-hydroxyacyl-CoA dehydrogenase [Lichenihabitans sp. Uapishka_5]|uniref:3-hydroxyacyl-CoA dehydrogenase n=1 Tax=Lichenihabitans sp. Uapishka_5 TaxID=3037302 RepID=UPI0029E82453|nr:3-hydroxyacyl-CoA dehydrogenase [Lichenihabitans sp. Uapishka_5]MDX7952623.1 3-hydroxyacyl-CoA dehydrogenase [Lichenihabitans sp. Uapishka_5]
MSDEHQPARGTVALVGGGVVGSAWAVVFARAGYAVRLSDVSPAAEAAALAGARDSLAALAAEGLAGPDTGDAVLNRITTPGSLHDALAGADYVQESAPERVEVKRELYRTLDTLVPPGIVIGSSTSGLPASSFTADMATRARCLVVHPINPPQLIPLVELVPAPWTSSDAVDRAATLMRDVGQAPIRLSREVNGFVVNRLQSAVLAEAFKLVADGICSAEDLDSAMSDGLGLRWAFMGPFETIDLNAKAGIAEYCRNLGPMYQGLAAEQAEMREWTPALVGAIERDRRARTSEAGLADRRLWRDRCLAGIVAAKRRIFDREGR